MLSGLLLLLCVVGYVSAAYDVLAVYKTESGSTQCQEEIFWLAIENRASTTWLDTDCVPESCYFADSLGYWVELKCSPTMPIPPDNHVVFQAYPDQYCTTEPYMTFSFITSSNLTEAEDECIPQSLWDEPGFLKVECVSTETFNGSIHYVCADSGCSKNCSPQLWETGTCEDGVTILDCNNVIDQKKNDPSVGSQLGIFIGSVFAAIFVIGAVLMVVLYKKNEKFRAGIRKLVGKDDRQRGQVDWAAIERFGEDN